ncbi:MAG: STAS domain-containing protein [Planctomycetota bacterium]
MLERLETRTQKINSNHYVIELIGSVSWDTYLQLGTALNQAIDAGCKYLKLDVGQVTTIHSCAFGPIIDAMVALESMGGSIGFRNVQSSSRRVFEILDKMEIKTA